MKKCILLLLSATWYLNSMHLSTSDEIYEQLAQQYHACCQKITDAKSKLAANRHLNTRQRQPLVDIKKAAQAHINDSMFLNTLLLNGITRGDAALVEKILTESPTVLHNDPPIHNSWFTFATYCATECKKKNPELSANINTIADLIVARGYLTGTNQNPLPNRATKVNTPKLPKVRPLTTLGKLPKKLPKLSTASLRSNLPSLPKLPDLPPLPELPTLSPLAQRLDRLSAKPRILETMPQTVAEYEAQYTREKQPKLKQNPKPHPVNHALWKQVAAVAVAIVCCKILYELYNRENQTNNDAYENQSEDG